MAGGSEGRDSGCSPPDTDTGGVGDLMGLEASANEHGPLFWPARSAEDARPQRAQHTFWSAATRPFNIALIMRRSGQWAGCADRGTRESATCPLRIIPALCYLAAIAPIGGWGD